MTVKELRIAINAAHEAGDTVLAAALQERLHAHFVADSEAFVNSPAGRAHVQSLANKFD